MAIVAVACKWCVPSASDVLLSKNDNSGEKTHEASEGVEYDFYFTENDFCPVWSYVLIFNPLSNKINLFMVINIWDIIIMIGNLKKCLWQTICICYLDVNWLMPKISACRARIWSLLASELSEQDTNFIFGQAGGYMVSIFVFLLLSRQAKLMIGNLTSKLSLDFFLSCFLNKSKYSFLY